MRKFCNPLLFYSFLALFFQTLKNIILIMMRLVKDADKYSKIFCCLILCLLISCFRKGDNGDSSYSPPMQYSPVQIFYPQLNRQTLPYSGYYRNPYSYSPQNYYPYYYDSDQYYVPPVGYQSFEDNHYREGAIRYKINSGDGFSEKF